MRWIIFVAALSIVGCGDETNSNNPGSSNGATNNGSSNGATNNGSSNGATNNSGATNNGGPNNGATNNNGGSNNAVTNNASTTNGSSNGVAEPCTADAECPTGLTCFVESTAGWTGGYCQTSCSADGDCPEGSHCADDACLKTCDGDTDCRGPDYGCWDGDDDGVSECLPLGSGAGGVGDPCTNYADCGGGQTGACVVQSGDDFVGGYCTITGCTVDNGCPVGSNCLDATSPPICLLNCMDAADCRADYQCSMATAAGTSCVPASL